MRLLSQFCGLQANTEEARLKVKSTMANASFRGWLWANDGTTSDPTGYFYNQGGIAATAANAIDVTGVYLWKGVNEWCVQFKFQINAANAKQGGWNRFDVQSSGARGTRGDAFGVFELTLNGFSYLFMPHKLFGYFDGSTTVTLFINSNTPRISPA